MTLGRLSGSALRATARRAVLRGLRLLPTPRTTPFTFWYLVVLALTTLVVDVVPAHVTDSLMALSSTSAANLAAHPLRVLLLSALWLSDRHWLVYAALFTVALAPLERRIGTGWTVLVFASGHVLASLVTELPVLVAVSAHLLPSGDAHLVDIGVSYGLFAGAGALLLVLPLPVRWWVIGALNAAILAMYLGMGPGTTDATVTAAGHLVALYVGMVGWLPWLRRRDLVGSLRPRRTYPEATFPEPYSPEPYQGQPSTGSRSAESTASATNTSIR